MMLDEGCLKLGICDYLKYFDRFGGTRGVAVITDKQYIFYTQILDDDNRTHESLIIDIEENIHPLSNRKKYDTLRENNVYVMIYGHKYFVISLPDNGQLSRSQLSFINDVLDEVDKYNKLEKKKVLINLTFPGSYLVNFKDSDIVEIKEYLAKFVTRNISIEEEKIIGKTIDVEGIKENLKFHINFKDCNKIFDILTLLDWVEFTFANDSYYKNIFNELFPDFKEVCDMNNILLQLCGMSVIYQKVENVTYNNIFNIFLNCINNNVFKKIKKYEQIKDFILTIENIRKSNIMLENVINKFFPNFDFFEKFIIDLESDNEIDKNNIEELISNINSYEELFKIIYEFLNNRQKKMLDNNRNLLNNKLVDVGCDIVFKTDIRKR